MLLRTRTLVVVAAVACLAAGAAHAEQGDSEIGFRALWVTGNATASDAIADTGSSPTLSSAPGFEIDWIMWPLDELTVELGVGATGHSIGTTGGALAGLDGGTLWRIPISAIAQYRPRIVDRLDPYVGLGVVYTVMATRMSSDYGAWLSDLEFSNELDLVAQVGLSYALDVRWSANLDIRYSPLRTVGTFTDLDGNDFARTEFEVDPWVIGLGFRFRY